METKTRQVRIVTRDICNSQCRAPHRFYFVEYVDRKPRTRHFANQFSAKCSSMADVIAWVKAQPNLKLVD